MTPEDVASLALAAMYSAVDEDGQKAVIAQAIREARQATLEEAARTVEGYKSISWCEENYAKEIAAAIRALKDKP